MPPVGHIDRIHSTLSAVARSVQSGVVCPSSRQVSTSSQTNIVSWSVSSDDNDLITEFIVSLCLHNWESVRIWASMFYLHRNKGIFPSYTKWYKQYIPITIYLTYFLPTYVTEAAVLTSWTVGSLLFSQQLLIKLSPDCRPTDYRWADPSRWRSGWSRPRPRSPRWWEGGPCCEDTGGKPPSGNMAQSCTGWRAPWVRGVHLKPEIRF